MPILFQINTVANSGSTGRITEDIGELAISKDWESYIAYGRGKAKSKSNLMKITNKIDFDIDKIIEMLLSISYTINGYKKL